ncbi:MAG: hypothetical protein JRI25_04720, partial [Deltaproteobacteria bacterium]|nr:hypothetical protein [Deltaproteobacteria bacterium]
MQVEERNTPADNQATFYLLLVTCLVLLYVAAYLGFPAFPGNDLEAPDGWWSWADQSRYRAAAEAIAAGAPIQESPLGYPLLGAIFSRWMPNHLFFLPNLLFSVGSGVLFYEIVRRVVSRWEAILVLALVVVLTGLELQVSLLVPWPSIPTQFLAYAMLVLFLQSPTSPNRVVLLAALDGLVLLFRPEDALVLGPLVVAAALRLDGVRERSKAMALAGAVLALSVAVGALLGRSVTGYWALPDLLPFPGALSFDRVAVTTYLVFLDGIPIYRSLYPALLERLPWMVLVIPGVLVAVQRLGRQVWAVVGCGFLGILLFLVNPDTSPAVLYARGQVHALAWVLPLVGLASYLTIRFAVRALGWWVTALGILLPLAAAWPLRLQEVEGGPTDVHELVLLRIVLWDDRAVLMVDGRPLFPRRDYAVRRFYPRGTVLRGVMVHLW